MLMFSVAVVPFIARVGSGMVMPRTGMIFMEPLMGAVVGVMPIVVVSSIGEAIVVRIVMGIIEVTMEAAMAMCPLSTSAVLLNIAPVSRARARGGAWWNMCWVSNIWVIWTKL